MARLIRQVGDTRPDEEERNGPPQPAPQSQYFEPAAPRLARNTIIESTFEIGSRFRCTMRVDCVLKLQTRPA